MKNFKKRALIFTPMDLPFQNLDQKEKPHRWCGFFENVSLARNFNRNTPAGSRPFRIESHRVYQQTYFKTNYIPDRYSTSRQSSGSLYQLNNICS